MLVQGVTIVIHIEEVCFVARLHINLTLTLDTSEKFKFNTKIP